MSDTESSKNPPKRRKTITFKQKLEIIKKSEQGEKLAAIGRSLGLTRSTINTIVKDKERIKTHIKDGLNIQLISASRARSSVMEEMERLLKLWLVAQNQNNVPLSLSIIQEKARQIHAVLKHNMGESSTDCETFNASWGWFRRFKIRANLHHFKVTGDAASADVNAANEFRRKLESIIDEGGYYAQQIFNIGETGLFWKKMPANAFISNEEKHAAKDRLTLLLGGNASGDFKVTPLLVYHSETPRAFRGITKSSLPVIWKSNRRGRITVALFENWFTNHFVPSVENYCARKNLYFKALLVLNHAPGYPVSLDELSPNIKVVYLPPNTTSILQPVDQTIITMFKKYYTRTTMAGIIKAIDEDPNVSVKTFWKDYNILSAVLNIGACWEEIKETTMNRAWSKLCPQYVSENTIDETQNEIVKEILEMGQKLELEMDSEDVNNLLESHAEELTTDELIKLQEQIRAETISESDSDETTMPKALTLKTISEILSKVEDIIEVVENSDPDLERSLNVIQNLRNTTTCYKLLYQEKKKSSA